MPEEMIKIGGLWKGKDKNGKPMLSGPFTFGTRLVVLTNGYKEEDKHPDFNIYVTKDEKKDFKKKPAQNEGDETWG